MFHRNLAFGLPAWGGALGFVAGNASSATSTTATFPVTLISGGSTIVPQFDSTGGGAWVNMLSVAVSVLAGQTQSVVVGGLPPSATYTGRFRFLLMNGATLVATSNTVSATTAAAGAGTARAQQYMLLGTPLVIPTALKSATLPGANALKPGSTIVQRKLGASKNGTAQFPNISMNNNTNTQVAYWATFVSLPLVAQTIPSGTYTFKIGATSDTASTTYELAPCLYIYRPTTDAVVGYINDSATGLSSVFPTSDSTGGHVFTMSLGAGIVCQDSDVLVMEHFAIGARTTGTTVTLQSQYNGATDVTEGGSSHAAASGIFFPSNITFNESP